METCELWFTETYSLYHGLTFKIKEHLYSGRSEFQQIDVFETHNFGRLLVLDGMIMFTERDEFIYHEMLAHVPLMLHKKPRRVLVIGGGDGGTLREIARHETVEKVDIIEIDEKVVETSRTWTPSVGRGFDDARVHVHFADGAEYVRTTGETYDVAIVDSTDPTGPGKVLFEREFYSNLLRLVSPAGVLACQTESPFHEGEMVAGIYTELREAAKAYGLAPTAYIASIPTYPPGAWTFGVVNHAGPGENAPLDEKRAAKLETACRYWNRDIQKHAFGLPTYVREVVNGDRSNG